MIRNFKNVRLACLNYVRNFKQYRVFRGNQLLAPWGPHMSRAVLASAIPYLTFGHMVYTLSGANRLNPSLRHIAYLSQWVLGDFCSR